MNQPITQRSRVSVDFLLQERDILQRLCEQDIRPAAEQLRWLVLTEAQRRGLITNENTGAAVSEAKRRCF